MSRGTVTSRREVVQGAMRKAWLALSIAACGATPATKLPEARINVQTFVELASGPGNIAVTPDQRVFVSLHQFYAPTDPVVELRGKEVLPFPLGAKVKGAELDSVLGIRAD